MQRSKKKVFHDFKKKKKAVFHHQMAEIYFGPTRDDKFNRMNGIIYTEN